MAEVAAVDVGCRHPKGGAGGAEPRIIQSFAFGEGLEPQGVFGSSRVHVDGRRLPIGESGHVIDAVLRAARAGRKASVVHELRCRDCGLTERVDDVDLQRALRRLAGNGEAYAELSVIRRMVDLSKS